MNDYVDAPLPEYDPVQTPARIELVSGEQVTASNHLIKPNGWLWVWSNGHLSAKYPASQVKAVHPTRDRELSKASVEVEVGP